MAQTAKQIEFVETFARSIPNPVKCKEGRGVRNFDCIQYDECLVKAAKSMWSGFTCAKCLNYDGSDG